MYKCANRKRKRHGFRRAFAILGQGLFLLVVFLRRLDSAVVRCLSFGFFHRLFGFGSLLGTGFGALLALFVEDLLAPEKFQECLVGSVSLVPRRADDARISAVAVAETRSNRVEQLYDGFVGHQV